MEHITSKSTFMKIENTNSEEAILKLKNESIDIICIDPPYLYLKNQKLEREFDEAKFFEQCKRVLTKGGFIIMFGRGVSFYRWNCILSDLGFTFKEEIIWDKSYSSSPVQTINRVHETITIFSKGKSVLNKIKIPYIEQKNNNITSIIQDIKRIKSALNNEKSFDAVLNYLETNERNDLTVKRSSVHNTTCQTKALGKQEVSTMMAIKNGMKEKTILKVLREHYTAIHPTQKPVRLLERLISLCLPNKFSENIWVADFFAGSFSTGEACYNLGVNFIGYEIDKEYFDAGSRRMEEIQFQTKLL